MDGSIEPVASPGDVVLPVGPQETVGDEPVVETHVYGMHDGSDERSAADKSRRSMLNRVPGQGFKPGNGNKLTHFAGKEPVVRE